MNPTPQEISAFQTAILKWYYSNQSSLPWRKQKLSCYEKIIAEILLQRTRPSSVLKIYSNFIERFPSWESIKNADEVEITEFLRPLGLWRQRKDSLIRLANEMVARKSVFPKKRKELENLPNIGQYIASSILLLCHGEVHPLIDINTARVIERYFGPRKLADIRDDPYLQETAYKVVSCGNPTIMNWGVLDLGRKVCIKSKPKCETCPLNSKCKFFNDNICYDERKINSK